MTFRLTLALAACFAPGIALSEAAPVDMDRLEACVSMSLARDCVGIGIEECPAALGGYSTVSHGFCLAAEMPWWEAHLDAVYTAGLARSRLIDADSANFGTPGRPSDVEALQVMQQAWVAFRDAACGYEELQWWGGSGSGIASMECITAMTADQIDRLQYFLSEE